MNGNIGNLGLPLCLFAFGQEGLILAIGFYVVGCIVVFVGGPIIQGKEASWQILTKTPIIYATIAGAAFLYWDLELPVAISNTCKILGGMLIPLMVISLGHALGTFGIVRPGMATAISLLRLVPGFLFGLLVVELLGLEGIERGVVIVQASMPVAVFNYLLASRYDRHPDVVAGSIVISTLISLLSLPLITSSSNGGSCPGPTRPSSSRLI
jgi:predicted permease